jgi:hypothetical protein
MITQMHYKLHKSINNKHTSTLFQMEKKQNELSNNFFLIGKFK